MNSEPDIRPIEGYWVPVGGPGFPLGHVAGEQRGKHLDDCWRPTFARSPASYTAPSRIRSTRNRECAGAGPVLTPGEVTTRTG